MAERKITAQDIFEGDIFEEVKASAKELHTILKELDELLKTFRKEQIKLLRDLAKAAPTVKTFNKLSQAVASANVALKASIQVNRALEQAEVRLAAAQSQEIKTVLKLKDATKELVNEKKAQVEAERAAAVVLEELGIRIDDVKNSYFALSDLLGNLRIAYKNLAAAGKESTPEAQALLEKITALDKQLKRIDYSVGQFQRNVGNYTGSMREFFAELTQKAEESGGVLGRVVTVIKQMGIAFKSAGGGLRGLAAGIRVLRVALISSGILALITLASELIGRLLDAIQALGQRLLGAVTGEGLAALKALDEALKRKEIELKIEREIFDLELKEKDILGDSLEDERERLDIKKQILDNQIKLLQLKRDELQLELQTVEAEIAKERSRGKFANKEKVEELQAKLLTLKGDIAEIDKDIERVTRAYLLEVVKYQAELKRAEKERLERLMAQKQQLLEQLELEKKRTDLVSEQLKQEYEERLRFIDSVEKKASEAGLSADKDILDALARARLDAEVQYQEKLAKLRVDSLQELQKITLSLQKDSFEKEKAQLDAEFAERELQITRLLAEAGDEDAFERYRTALVTLREAYNRELLQLRLKYVKNAIEQEYQAGQLEIDLQADKFEKLEDFEKFKRKELLRLRIQLIEKELEALRELFSQTNDPELEFAIKSLEAQRKVLELQLKAIETEVQTSVNRLSELYKDLEKTFNAIDALAERRFQRLQRRIERAEQAISTRISALVAQAEAGSINAEASIAELEKRQAQLQLEKEKLLQRAQRREAATAAFRAYASALAQGQTPSQALVQVIKDFSVLTQLIRSLPTYYQGTEFVKAKGARLSAATDTVLARLHVGERVIPKHINEQLKGIKNEDIPKLMGQQSVHFDVDSFTNALEVVVRRGSTVQKLKRKL